MTTDRSGSPAGGLADDGEPAQRRPGSGARSGRRPSVILVVAVGVAVLVKALLLQAFYIPSESMEPGLVRNDRILVEKVSYELGGSPATRRRGRVQGPGRLAAPEEAAGPDRRACRA